MNADIFSYGNEFYKIPAELEEYSYLNQQIAEKKDKEDDYIAVTK